MLGYGDVRTSRPVERLRSMFLTGGSLHKSPGDAGKLPPDFIGRPSPDPTIGGAATTDGFMIEYGSRAADALRWRSGPAPIPARARSSKPRQNGR